MRAASPASATTPAAPVFSQALFSWLAFLAGLPAELASRAAAAARPYLPASLPMGPFFFVVAVALLWSMEWVGSSRDSGGLSGGLALTGALLYSRAFVPQMMRDTVGAMPLAARLRGLAGFTAGMVYYAGALGPLRFGSRWGALTVEVLLRTDSWLGGARRSAAWRRAAVDGWMETAARVALTVALATLLVEFLPATPRAQPLAAD